MRVRHEGAAYGWGAGQCRGAALAAVLALAAGASCGGDKTRDGSSPSGAGVEIPIQPSEPALPAPVAPAKPGESTVDASPTSPLPARPEPRLVADFEREAQQATPRNADARGLGGSCQTTADCRLGLGCASVAFSGVTETNIAGGYCSRWCEQDEDCAANAGGGYCSVKYFGSDLNLCLAPCQTGETGAEKCAGRQDVSCGFLRAPYVDTTCLPRCQSDEDCSIGNCSAAHGLCDVRLPALPARVGASCSVSDPSACNGVCSATTSDAVRGVCSGYCRLGSTCGEGPGTVCAPEEFGLREGDGGTCEQSCSTSADCKAGYTACAPTGFLLPSGEPQRGCSLVYSEPASLAPQRLSREQLQLAALPSSVINVSTTSIFQGLSHVLDVQDGAVCVSGTVTGAAGALIYLDFQLRPNNGGPLDASDLSAFTFDTEGPHVVRFDAYTPAVDLSTPEVFYRYLAADRSAGDLGEGPQRIGTDELFNLFAGNAPFTALERPQLEALRFSLILEDGPGAFRFCIGNLVLQARTAADAGL